MTAHHTIESTFEELWRTHAKQLFRITNRITRNREDAEDALQESFLRAYVHLHSFDGRSSLATWLTRIAINSALMILRKRTHAPQLLSLNDSGDDAANFPSISVADRGPSPEARYVHLEQQTIVREGVRGLRPSIRQAIEIQVLEDQSVKETAEQMGLSITATKSRIFQAKAALRKSLRRNTGRRIRGMAQLQPKLA
jgi:RNA polymerase sigma-70 factor (ECF subfamily)